MGRTWRESNSVLFWDFDTSTLANSRTLTNVTSTAWIDMSRWGRVVFMVVRIAGTGNILNAGIYASAASTGSSAALVGSLFGSTAASGLWMTTVCNGTNLLSPMVGDPDAGYLILEASYDQVAAALSGGRYVTLRMASAADADEFAICAILTEPRKKTTGLPAAFNR